MAPTTCLSNADSIFTDLRLDNVLFACPSSKADIEAQLRVDGPPVIDGEFEFSGKKYPIMRSQPFTHNFPWDASRHLTELLTVYLTDFGDGVFHLSQLSTIVCHNFRCSLSALKVDMVPPTLEISPYALRAPEVILGAKFDTKIDVWALGCIVSSIHQLIMQCGFLKIASA
jgi:serine/threonine-protein kinase SRPK3